MYIYKKYVCNMFFANDSLLFCRANSQECSNILKLLSVYEASSGQKINKEETTLFFNKSTTNAIKETIKGLLVGEGKRASLNYIKERAWRKLQGWEGKLLSQSGREVLIKSVIQAITTYAIRCFKLPLGSCHEIEAVIKKFWWEQHGDKRKFTGLVGKN